jgi:hypothetical protein
MLGQVVSGLDMFYTVRPGCTYKSSSVRVKQVRPC